MLSCAPRLAALRLLPPDPAGPELTRPPARLRADLITPGLHYYYSAGLLRVYDSDQRSQCATQRGRRRV